MKSTTSTTTKRPLILTAISMLLLTSCAAVDNKRGNNDSNYGDISPMKSGSTACGIYDELEPPPTVRAAMGLLKTKLTAKVVSKCIGGQNYSLMSYIDSRTGTDSRPVGPAYILNVDSSKQGPLLDIDFSNELSDPATGPHDCGHHGTDLKTCTNLHTHGFHVSPESPADNVYLKLSPGDKFHYMYNIPNFHPPGTHWLHAHLHGSTAPQVQEGMAGALILKGDIDRWLARDYGISGDKDKIMILQQLQVDDSNGDSMTLCPDSLTTSINGQCLPNITVEAGEIQHWRLIHAGISASVHFALENSNGKKLDLYEYAKDGINMGRMYQLQDVEMQPGYRSDLLVKMPTPGDDICPGTGDCILDIVDVQPPTNARSFNGAGESREIIGRVTITSSSTSAQQLPPINDSHFAKPYPEITQEEIEASNQPVEEIWFASEVDASTVNGEEFPYGTTSQLTLGEAQVWKVWVGDDQPADNTGNHPFHIHVNPFEVIERDQSGHIYKRYWKDTILINATYNRKDSPVELRSRYDDFTGKFVLHCHNLNHEDAGMMKSVQINP